MKLRPMSEAPLYLRRIWAKMQREGGNSEFCREVVFVSALAPGHQDYRIFLENTLPWSDPRFRLSARGETGRLEHVACDVFVP